MPDAGTALLPDEWRPEPARLLAACDAMILSASGWRAVFAQDGEEESAQPGVSPEHLLLAALAARAFVLEAPRAAAAGTLLVGQDTRPTGPLLAQAAIRSLLAADWRVDYLYLVASPEIMTWTRMRDDAAGFFYVSASHNPLGHNGIKMGLADGSVVGGERSRKLISRFRELASDEEELHRITGAIRHGSAREADVYARTQNNKNAALASYRDFTRLVIQGPGPRAEALYEGLLHELRRARPGVVLDANGSARAVSIDAKFLTDAGCMVRTVNEVPGVIAHQILPEGEGLSEGMSLLAEAHRSDPRFVLGYVPDNDGDRGNLVVVDGGGVRPLEAQEVFALSCVGELSWLTCTGALEEAESTGKPVAIVVNGPTSMRIERIAALFGVEVHRAEVGEANVVSRARELRDQGYLVRILGEGSNGGNITHPQAVRDPIQTVFALLKMLHSPPDGGKPGPLELWHGLNGSAADAKSAGGTEAGLSALLRSLPSFTTTSTSDPLAIMKVSTADHNALKHEVELLWEARWPSLAPGLSEELGVTGFEYRNYEGTRERAGRGNRTGAGRGGLKILLHDPYGVGQAFLWMRGSGTEPVFRVMVDVEGDRPQTERSLIRLLREIVQEADAPGST
jgi:phosphoglucomutase